MYSMAGISTSIFIDHQDGGLLMDCGDGALRDLIEILRSRLSEAGLPTEVDLASVGNQLDAVLISHAHFDHYAGLLTLLEFLHLIGRDRPLLIIYPVEGSAVEGLVDHFSDHLWEEPGFAIDLMPLIHGDRVSINDVSIEAFKAVHRNSKPGKTGSFIAALSFRLSCNGEVVSYSGDTSDVDELKEVVRGSDLAIIESTFTEDHPHSNGVHLTTGEALEIGMTAKEYLLVHFTSSSLKEVEEKGISILGPGNIELED